MLSPNLANQIQLEIDQKEMPSFSLNFKIEGENMDKFDKIAQKLRKSRTELAKFIINNSLDDMLNQIGSMTFENAPVDHLPGTLIELTEQKIAALSPGEKFELKNLIGEDWDRVGDHGAKNRAGKVFKKQVQSGEIQGVKFLNTKTNNHASYKKI